MFENNLCLSHFLLVQVIILAESHIFTDEENSRLGPILSEEILPRSEYSGPRDYASVHLCLGYGESKALVPRKNQEPKSTTPKGSSQGTPAFWSILAACSSFSSNETKLLLKKNPTGDSQKKRLLLKLRILQDLKDRGVWLIDASILGYYISQERSYYITWKSKLAHTVTQPRPPNRFYRPSFILSWELYTKHVVRQAAADGCLKLLIPIGKAVENAITRNRLEDAITVPLKTSSCEVTAAFPQPNAWLKHGYEETRQKISQLVNMATPPFRVTRSRGRTTEGGVKLHRIRKGGLENLPQPRTKAARGPGKRKQSSEKTKQLPSTMKEKGNQRRLSELSHSIEPGKQENIPVAAFMAKLNDVYPDSFAAKLNEVYPT